MEIITDTVTSGARMAGNYAATKLHKRSLSTPSRTLRSAAEHLPSVDRQRLRTEKYLALSIIIPFK
jgi:chitin synthase